LKGDEGDAYLFTEGLGLLYELIREAREKLDALPRAAPPARASVAVESYQDAL
jgi:hypothetical protein